MAFPSTTETPGSLEPPDSRAFSEALRKLWEAHSAEVKHLKLANERLRSKLHAPDGKSDVEKASGDEVRALASVSSDDTPHTPSPKKEAAVRSAWMPVVSTTTPVRKPSLFEPVIEMPRSIWFTATRVITHPMFDFVVAFVIFLNAVVMAIEAQWQGLSVGASLNFGSIESYHATTWASAEHVFLWMGFVFGLIYSAELILKLVGQRGSFFKFGWNWIDMMIVLFWIVDVSAGTALPVDATLLRVARLVRLLRLVQLMQTIKSLDALYIITTALSGSFSILAWACVLFFFLQMGLALLITGYLTEYYFNDANVPEQNRQAVYVYFGTFSRSIYSMFEITLANWPPASRLLAENVSEWFMLFGIIHKLTIGFAVVSVVNGVFMQETFHVAASDDRVMIQKRKRNSQMHRFKMERFFRLADKTSDGAIDMDEFRQMTEHKEVSAWLQAMELDVSDPDKLFILIDSSRSIHETMASTTGLAVLMRFRAALLSRALELGFPQRQDGKEDVWQVEILEMPQCAATPPIGDAANRGTKRHEKRSFLLGRRHLGRTVLAKKPNVTSFLPSQGCIAALLWIPDFLNSQFRRLAIADMVAESMLRILDLDRLTRHEFGLASVVQKLAPHIFEMLCHGEPGKVMEDGFQSEESDFSLSFSLSLALTGPPVHELLYQDAKRREAARREALQPSVTVAKPRHDPEYIDRLAKPSQREEEEAGAGQPEIHAKKKLLNIGRIMELADEKRVWYEVRERQRQEKMDQEVKGCEDAAAQLRHEVARKSRMTIAVRRWREMLAQVLLISAFAPGLRVGSDAGPSAFGGESRQHSLRGRWCECQLEGQNPHYHDCPLEAAREIQAG
ncbi:Scn8a [Symbiodinium pilosum]|uniref:Scn8a protein n=1 Tax=Symbiodinium pilosum TaxID=2952 RepID=A0A812K3B5_SYMPI|nr:Scn8a [Symbiodinium pilosum]